MSGQTDCATASREIGRGLNDLLGGLGEVKDIVVAIHEALTEEPPASPLPQILAEMTAEMRALRLAIEGARKDPC